MALYEFETEALENCDDLEAYNHTELYQLCRAAERKVSPATDRAGLANALLEGCSGEDRNPIDGLRDGLMDFLLAHWKRVHAQLFCPAKSGDPKACYTCCDAQAVHCLVVNPKIEPEVLERIENMEQANVSMKFNIDNAPRNFDELKAIGPLRLRYLALAIGVCPTGESRSAFCSMKVEDQAKNILEFLQRHDASKPKTTQPAPLATPPIAAAAAETVSEPPVTEIPAAPSAAEPPALKRNPRGRPPKSATVPAAVEQPASQLLQAPMPDISGSSNSLGALIEEVSSLLDKNLGPVAKQVSEMRGTLEELNLQLRVNTAICLLLAQAILEDSRPEILSVAAADLEDISAALGKALNGGHKTGRVPASP